VNVSTCGNAFYDNGISVNAHFFEGGGHAGDSNYLFALKIELADFGFTPSDTQITSFCVGNQIDYTGAGGPWSNEVFIYPDSGGLPDESTVLGQGTIVTGDGGGWYKVTLPTPVLLNGDFWLANRGHIEHAGTDFNMEIDTPGPSTNSYASSGGGIAGLSQSDNVNYMLRATLGVYVPAGTIFSDGFESGNTTVWSGSEP